MTNSSTDPEYPQPDNQLFDCEDPERKVLEDRLKEVLRENRQTILKDHMPAPQEGIKFATGDVKSSEADKRTFSVSRVDGRDVEKKTATVNDSMLIVEEKSNVFTPMSYKTLLQLPPKEWIIDRFFGIEDLCMIYGASGSGKTFISIDMIVSSYKGSKWANRFDIKKRPINVFYCAGEGVSGLPARFEAAVKHYELDDLPNLTFFPKIPQLYLDNGESIDVFKKELENGIKDNKLTSPDLIVIDTMHTAILEAEENSSRDMGKVLHKCRDIAASQKCAVLLVHHSNKLGSSERGSGAVRGSCDCIIEIQGADSGKSSKMVCSKLKDGESWQTQEFRLEKMEGSSSVYVSWGELCDANKSGVKNEHNEEQYKEVLINELRKDPGLRHSSTRLSKNLGQSTDYTKKILMKMVDDGMCQKELPAPEKIAGPHNSWQFYI